MNTTISSKTNVWNEVQEENQYSLTKIVGIWAAVTIPYFISGFITVGRSLTAPTADSEPDLRC